MARKTHYEAFSRPAPNLPSWRYPANNEGGEAHRGGHGGHGSAQADCNVCAHRRRFQRKTNHSQKESRCQTKRSMSPGAENHTARSVGGSDLDLGWRAGASEFEDVGKTSRD